jgi:hypothetical protein
VPFLRNADFEIALLRPVVDASYRARAPTSGCLEGTRSSVLQKIVTWSSDDITKVPRVFWLSGLGGTGKSTISHTICKTLLDNGQLGASFFFSRDVANRRRTSSVIPTIAYQLAYVNAEYRRKLCDVLRANPEAPSHAQKYQLTELLLDPLKKVPSLPMYLIVLDALDECDKERGKEGGDLIPLILRELPDAGLNIKVLVTSRPEKSILDMFKLTGRGMSIYDTSVLHDMDETAAKEDIALYFKHHFQHIQVDRNINPPWPEDMVFDELVARAGLFFIFAATIIQFIEDDFYSPDTQLERLMESQNTKSQAMYLQVDLLYLRILQSSFKGRLDIAELSIRFKEVVGAIILLQDPLAISVLAHLLGYKEADLSASLSHLHSLLHIPHDHDKSIRIFHPSFRDFLTTQERCQDPHFFIAAGHTHAQLVLHCLKIMLKFLKRNICNVDNTVVLNSEIPDLESKLKNCVPPALSYACQYWGAHLLQSTASDSNLHKEILNKLLEFTSIKLLCWIEVLSLEGKFSTCIDNLVAVMSWCKVIYIIHVLIR